jgi:hypothetical protein
VLLAVGPDMAKVLTVVALCKDSLSSIWFRLFSLNISFDFKFLVKVTRKRGLHIGLSVGCSSIGCHLLHIDDVETYVLKAAGNMFRRCVWGKVIGLDNLDRLFEIWGGGRIVEIMFLQIGLHCGIVHPFFCYDMGSVSFVSELVLSFDMFF